jgi:tetratricopeptide (TPR) repeat protein
MPPNHTPSTLRCRRWLLSSVVSIAFAAPGIAAAANATGPLAPLPPPVLAPFVPSAEAQVLQQVPSASDPKVRAMRTLRQRLDAAPADVEAAQRLAEAYVDFGRQVGDAHYAGYAEAVIGPLLAVPQPAARTWVVDAGILQYRHQFPEARAALAKALARDPRNEPAWLMLATLDLVQGDYAAAGRSCGRVAGGDYTLGLACGATLRSLTGQAQQSVAVLDLLAARDAGLGVELKSWIEGLSAESCERLGRWDDAEAHYRKALALVPEDNFLLVAYADFLLDRQRPAEVLPLLADHTQSDTAFLRLVLAQAALRSADLSNYVWTMAARFEALRQRGSEYFGREEVRFALDLQHDPAAALELARQNWQVQREPWDARVFLAAALAADQPLVARPVLDFVEHSKLEDPVIADLSARLRARLGGAKAAP